jgi:hypothetical protein
MSKLSLSGLFTYLNGKKPADETQTFSSVQSSFVPYYRQRDFGILPSIQSPALKDDQKPRPPVEAIEEPSLLDRARAVVGLY